MWSSVCAGWVTTVMESLRNARAGMGADDETGGCQSVSRSGLVGLDSNLIPLLSRATAYRSRAKATLISLAGRLSVAELRNELSSASNNRI